MFSEEDGWIEIAVAGVLRFAALACPNTHTGHPGGLGMHARYSTADPTVTYKPMRSAPGDGPASRLGHDVMEWPGVGSGRGISPNSGTGAGEQRRASGRIGLAIDRAGARSQDTRHPAGTWVVFAGRDWVGNIYNDMWVLYCKHH
jgi:hypothetical protein